MKDQSCVPPCRHIFNNTLVAVAVIILFASSRTAVAQWTQPNGNGDINSTNSGKVGIGTTAPGAKLTVSNNSQSAPAGQSGTTAQIVGANGTSTRLLVDSFGAVISSIDLRRANNTAATPSALLNGDNIGQITWQGYGATSYSSASRAKILVAAAESYTDMAQGAFMTFSVAPRGGLTAAEAMRIDATGFIGIGNPAPAYKLDVAGQIRSSSGGFIFPDGSVQLTASTSAPSSGWTDSSATINLTNSTGKVGIGTTMPLQRLQIGTNTITSTATPDSVSLGATYSSVAGANAKLRLFDNNAGTVYGLGISSGQFDFIVPAASRYVWNVNGVEKMRLDETGNITISGNINAKYQDVAEWVESSEELKAGTVVVLDAGKSNQVIASTRAYDTRVAGVISLQPGIALGEGGQGRVLVAATGRVKVKVDAGTGPIHIGDLLVTSDKPGFAMKSSPVEIGGVSLHRPGTIIGKALEPLDKGTGEILVLVSLQ